MRRLRAAVLATCALLAWGEWLNRRWSRALTGSHRSEGSSAVVVLGSRNHGTGIDVVNRWRVRIGLRSLASAPDGLLVLSGGVTGDGPPSEARLLADHALALGYTGPLLLDEDSLTTWENVTNVIPLVQDADRIVFASQPGHALKARAYLRRQRPDLAARLVRGEDHRPGEYLLLKPLLAAYGLWTLRGLTRDERRG